MSSRYIINVTTKGGQRLFSTSRSSIGNDKAKLARLVNLFDILVGGAPEEEDMSMEVVRIEDATATPCTLIGEPILVVGKVDTTLADLGDIDSHVGTGLAINDPALGEHPVAKANAASWDFKSKKTKTEWHGPGVAVGPVEWVESLQDNGPPITHADFGNDRYVIRPLLTNDGKLAAGYSLTCNNVSVCDFYSTRGEAKDAAIKHANA